jgi:hypothetical protein
MSDLTDLIRAKYPDSYKDMSDEDLEKSVLAKYPQYKDLASKGTTDAKPVTSNPAKAQSAPAEQKPNDSNDGERSSFLTSLYKAANTPLTDAPSRAADYLSNIIDPGRGTTGLKSIASAFVEGLGHEISGLTSPLSLGLAGASEGAQVASKVGAPIIASGLRRVAQAASIPIVSQGIHDTITKPRIDEKLAGLAQTVLGGAGLAEGNLGKIGEAAKDNSPVSSGTPINVDIPKTITEQPRPAGPWEGNPVTESKIKPKSAEDLAYDIAREKFNMGKDLPQDNKVTKPTATFKGFQEDPEGGEFPMFDIKGGDSHGSTVTESGLKKLGIEVPEVPDNPNRISDEEFQRRNAASTEPKAKLVLSDPDRYEQTRQFFKDDIERMKAERLARESDPTYQASQKAKMDDWNNMQQNLRINSQVEKEFGMGIGGDFYKSYDKLSPSDKAAFDARFEELKNQNKPKNTIDVTPTKVEDVAKDFGGNGHPDDADYVSRVLSKVAPKGEPGLSVEKADIGSHIVYRNPDGDPIGVAHVVTDKDGTNLVQDLAVDKSKGLLTGRAAKAIGQKLDEVGATEASGTMSNDATNFQSKKNTVAPNFGKDKKYNDYIQNNIFPEKTPEDAANRILLGKSGEGSVPPENTDSAHVVGEAPESPDKAPPRNVDLLTRLANLGSKTTRTVLGTHIPGTAISFHGFNEVVRNTLFGSDYNPLSAASRGVDALHMLVRPGKAAEFLDLNKDNLAKAMQDGKLTAQINDVNTASMFKGSNPVSRTLNYLTDPKPLFQQVIPALKLKAYTKLVAEMQGKGVPYKYAALRAGEATNNIFGGLNLEQLQRSPITQKLFRATALAPDWLETNARLGQGIAKSIGRLSDPELKAYRVGAANFLGSYIIGNIINAINNNGKFSFQNDPGHELDIASGKDSAGRVRYLRPYGTSMDMVRIPLAIAHSAVNGNLGESFNMLRSRASEPLQFATDLMTNSDWKGDPIYDKNKYGKPLNYTQQTANFANDAVGHFAPTGIDSGLNYYQGKISPEEFASRVLQLPLGYKKPAKSARR